MSATTVAQPPAPPPAWTYDPAPTEPAGRSLAVGHQKLSAGDRLGAASAYLDALALHGRSRAVLTALLKAAGDDADARAYWGYALLEAMADSHGRVKVNRDLEAQLPADPTMAALLASRAAAATELLAFADRLRAKGSGSLGNGVLARWASDSAWLLTSGMPSLLHAQHAAWRSLVARHGADLPLVIKALTEVMQNPPAVKPPATGPDPVDAALRAARCLSGFAAQTGYQGLLEPEPPDLRDAGKLARQTRERLRSKINSEPLTIEQLEELDADERQRFSATHARWSNPAVAISPRGRYRIETTCGWATLLGVAQTIELHHERLVGWYGKDPFGDQQGLVRIVPNADDLEAEGAPFWWASGFQSGPVTQVQFHWGTIESLGHTLTHELTHRFDGTLLPFLPAWLIEGRAVWTASAYRQSSDPAFEPRRLDLDPAVAAYVKGYGNARKLRELLAGTIDEYRDNYTAGYALWVYLLTGGESGEALFGAALPRYLQALRALKNAPVEGFEQHFATGKDGRPSGLEAFAAGFNAFLTACYQWSWGEKDQAPWLGDYVLALPPPKDDPLVPEVETFVTTRQRAEPAFGQGHARRAAQLLADLGKTEAAAHAGLWSLAVDEAEPAEAKRLATLLAQHGAQDAAWAVRHELWRQAPQAASPPGEPPFAQRLPRLSEYSKALAEAALRHRQRGEVRTAASLTFAHSALSQVLGSATPAVADAPEPGICPLPGPQRGLGSFGYLESGLTNFEDRRQPGLWYEDHGDLHVGRSRPREGTGQIDREAHQQHAFVHTSERFRGAFRLRLRVHLTTSYASGCVVIGYQRRDRNVRINFSAGNFLYSVGRADDPGLIDRVRVDIDPLSPRARYLPGSVAAAEVKLGQPAPWFDLDVVVDGPRLVVRVDDQTKLVHAALDGQPIEGAIGFAMRQGAIRVQGPVVQAILPEPPIDLLVTDFSDRDALLRRPATGLPLAPAGTLALWIPADTDPGQVVHNVERGLQAIAEPLADPTGWPQAWVLMIPPELPPEARAHVDNAVKDSSRLTVLQHRVREPTGASPRELFVDGRGILRVIQLTLPGARIGGHAASWAKRYREATATR